MCLSYSRIIPAATKAKLPLRIAQRSLLTPANSESALKHVPASSAFMRKRSLYCDIQIFQKHLEFDSNSGSHDSKQTGSFIDLAIWLGLVAQLVIYLGVVRPKQHKEEGNQDLHTKM
ncbi:hypothetical protein L596_009412 [Steinernema carpocapsae]|uniref:Uncharacterized protein n=1 Tax=Steinernema carpocapsae TaxID=34508 RepID=A0A4V6A6M3_STECR|nr:hypothetical protein L596_009412 [Steinernema carpocapsae]